MAGGWSNTSTDEITAPGSVPFLPGYDVVGLGTQLPAELTAAGYKNAIVFYSNTWNPAATVSTIKFRFIATNPTSGDLILGYGICANPSVSQTATIQTGLDLNLQGLIAPPGATFAAGNNVIGIGASLPTELSAAGFVDALVFYSTEWNPANVTPTIKFRFIGATSTGMSLGYGICANPSVSQTATVVSAGVLRTPGTFFGMSVNNPSNSPVFYLVDDGSGGVTGHGGLLDILDSSGFARIRQQANTGGTSTIVGLYDTLNNQRIDLTAVNTGQTTLGIHDKNNKQRVVLGDLTGGGDAILYLYDQNGVGRFLVTANTAQVAFNCFSAQLLVPSSSAYIQTNVPLEWDTAWSTIPLVNGWTSDVSRTAQYRLMADGTTQLKGYIFKASFPLNGEQWMNALPIQYAPLHTWSFLSNTPGQTYNGTQVAEVHSDGTGVVYDPPATNGTMSLDSIRFASQY